MWFFCIRYTQVIDLCNIQLTCLLQCQHIRSLDDFFLDIQMDPVEIAVIGCGCTVATEPVAEISHRWNIPQVCVAKEDRFNNANPLNQRNFLIG